jgi:hypothetical protein
MATPQSNVRFRDTCVMAILCGLSLLALKHFDGGKGWTYLQKHFWLVGFLPLVVLFVALLGRSYYLQYKQ